MGWWVGLGVVTRHELGRLISISVLSKTTRVRQVTHHPSQSTNTATNGKQYLKLKQWSGGSTVVRRIYQESELSAR